MASWRVARSLETFVAQCNRQWPHRSRASDGTIGDARHKAETQSDHNVNSHGVVTAFDLTHDPSHGVNCDAIADALRRTKDERTKYVIWDHRIFSADQDWAWRAYSGADPHTNHLHLSVSATPRLYDDAARWTALTPEDDVTNDDIEKIADRVVEKLWTEKPAEADADGDRWAPLVQLQRIKVLVNRLAKK